VHYKPHKQSFGHAKGYMLFLLVRICRDKENKVKCIYQFVIPHRMGTCYPTFIGLPCVGTCYPTYIGLLRVVGGTCANLTYEAHWLPSKERRTLLQCRVVFWLPSKERRPSCSAASCPLFANVWGHSYPITLAEPRLSYIKHESNSQLVFPQTTWCSRYHHNIIK
jgi:hypothetical protein